MKAGRPKANTQNVNVVQMDIVIINLNGIEIDSLMDNGAEINLISQNFLNRNFERF